jgi:hypothetical protein
MKTKQRAENPRTKKKAAVSVGSGRMVRMRLSLTTEECEHLLYLVREASGEPSDIDYEALLSICNKVEAALAHPNDPVSHGAGK